MSSATALARSRARARANERVEAARRAAHRSLLELQRATTAARQIGPAPLPVAPVRGHGALYRLCLAGREPAESLPTKERELLVAELCTAGWTDQQIADHTHMTLYTAARIRARLELSPNDAGEVVT